MVNRAAGGPMENIIKNTGKNVSKITQIVKNVGKKIWKRSGKHPGNVGKKLGNVGKLV